MDNHSLSEPPKISVVMTAYNSGRVIRSTLESLLNQTLRDFELIVVDDCSKDDTVAIIDSYRDPRVRVVWNAENLGISRSRNIGLDLARGDYIAMSDHDDISLPTRLESQAAFLDANPDYIMVAVGCIEQTETSRTPLPITANPSLLHWTLFQRCPLAHSSVCVRRDAMRRAGIRYNPAYAYAEDFHLYHLLGRAGKIGMVNAHLMLYMIHPHNTTHSVLGDMGRNGLAFMREQYRDYLGFIDRDDDVALVWSLCNQNTPASGIDELKRLGSFLAESCSKFSGIQRLGEDDRALLRQDAANTWWRAVRMSAEKTGQPGLLMAGRKARPAGLPPPSLSGDATSYALSLARLCLRTLGIRKQ
jgi:glycosyltransferase involved in cell wall biosynthesis